LHIGGKEVLYRAALNELADRLDPLRFVRVHRSAIINIEGVLRLEPISHRDFEPILKDGSRARISRNVSRAAGKRDRVNPYSALLIAS
jgi:two-component system LytT family response regulator